MKNFDLGIQKEFNFNFEDYSGFAIINTVPFHPHQYSRKEFESTLPFRSTPEIVSFKAMEPAAIKAAKKYEIDLIYVDTNKIDFVDAGAIRDLTNRGVFVEFRLVDLFENTAKFIRCFFSALRATSRIIVSSGARNKFELRTAEETILILVGIGVSKRRAEKIVCLNVNLLLKQCAQNRYLIGSVVNVDQGNLKTDFI